MSENVNNDKYEQAIKVWLANNSNELKRRCSWGEYQKLNTDEIIELIGEPIEFVSGGVYDYDETYEESPSGLEFTFDGRGLVENMDMVPAGKFLAEVSALIAEGN